MDSVLLLSTNSNYLVCSKGEERRKGDGKGASLPTSRSYDYLPVQRMLISFSPLTGWTLLLQIELNSFSIKSKHCPYSFQITDMVAQIEFTEWTPDGHLRHSRFVGLREDKKAREVVREG